MHNAVETYHKFLLSGINPPFFWNSASAAPMALSSKPHTIIRRTRWRWPLKCLSIFPHWSPGKQALDFASDSIAQFSVNIRQSGGTIEQYYRTILKMTACCNRLAQYYYSIVQYCYSIAQCSNSTDQWQEDKWQNNTLQSKDIVQNQLLRTAHLGNRWQWSSRHQAILPGHEVDSGTGPNRLDAGRCGLLWTLQRQWAARPHQCNSHICHNQQDPPDRCSPYTCGVKTQQYMYECGDCTICSVITQHHSRNFHMD